MAPENVETVHRFNDPYEGADLMPLIREWVGRFGTEPDPDVVLSTWAEDPAWRHVDPNVQWDTSAIGGIGSKVTGPREVARWWGDWTEAWESYVYRTDAYRDLGEWVFTQTHIEARTTSDLPVEMTVFQLWRVRDGKVAVCRVFTSEAEALEAADSPQ